uniref:Uncharacterized protein n=1 Tax=Trichogramma kaykai TaxID=54128 RepID=A0ABD2XGV5_9HYME
MYILPRTPSFSRGYCTLRELELPAPTTLYPPPLRTHTHTHTHAEATPCSHHHHHLALYARKFRNFFPAFIARLINLSFLIGTLIRASAQAASTAPQLYVLELLYSCRWYL